MKEFITSIKSENIILALGAESAGNFSIFKDGKIYFSDDFGDLQETDNFKKYFRELNKFLQENQIIPDVILSDLHPDFATSHLAKKLAKKHKAQHVQVQHHLAHISSAVGDRIIHDTKYKIQDTVVGIACDGTGYGLDGKIWGGEIFKIKNQKSKIKIERVGHLESQILIGGQKAIEQPARMLISILSKFLSKEEIYFYLKKYYSKNEFELLWNQLQQNFNCLETSSTARILDAVSVLLGFSKNERTEKHGPVFLLERNSTRPYYLKPKIERYKIQDTITKQILNTTFLFKYLVKNLHKDKRRLAATAQMYIADGLWEIIKSYHPELVSGSEVLLGEMLKQVQHDKFHKAKSYKLEAVFSGGMANNKIISSILNDYGVYISKKIPSGDAGISFGQIFFYLTNPRD